AKFAKMTLYISTILSKLSTNMALIDIPILLLSVVGRYWIWLGSPPLFHIAALNISVFPRRSLLKTIQALGLKMRLAIRAKRILLAHSTHLMPYLMMRFFCKH